MAHAASVGLGPLIEFFKTGPIACNGIISFRLFVTEFLIWMVVTSRAHTRLEQAADGHERGGADTGLRGMGMSAAAPTPAFGGA